MARDDTSLAKRITKWCISRVRLEYIILVDFPTASDLTSIA